MPLPGLPIGKAFMISNVVFVPCKRNVTIWVSEVKLPVNKISPNSGFVKIYSKDLKAGEDVSPEF